MGKDYKRRGSGGAVSAITCEDLSFQTILNSPVEEVLATLKLGDCLEVVSVRHDGRQIAVAQRNGQTAGSITCAELAKLLQCLAQGNKFSAIVSSVSKGRCHVVVTPGVCK